MISQKHEKKKESFVKVFLRERWILASFDLWNNDLKQCIESFLKNHSETWFADSPCATFSCPSPGVSNLRLFEPLVVVPFGGK